MTAIDFITYFVPILIAVLFTYISNLVYQKEANSKTGQESRIKDKNDTLLVLSFPFLMLAAIVFFTFIYFKFAFPIFNPIDLSFDLTIEKESFSPSQKLIATFFSLSGGGAAGWMIMKVSLRSKDTPFNADSNVVLEMRHGYEVNFNWVDENTLQIFYPESAEVDKKIEFLKETKIVYEKKKKGNENL